MWFRIGRAGLPARLDGQRRVPESETTWTCSPRPPTGGSCRPGGTRTAAGPTGSTSPAASPRTGRPSRPSPGTPGTSTSSPSAPTTGSTAAGGTNGRLGRLVPAAGHHRPADATVTVVARHPEPARPLHHRRRRPDHLHLVGLRTAAGPDWFQVSGGVASAGSPVTAIARFPTTSTCSPSAPTTASTAPGGTTPPAGPAGSTSPAASASPAARSTAIQRYADHIDLFTVGSDSLVYSTWWDSSSGWAGWFPLSIT